MSSMNALEFGTSNSDHNVMWKKAITYTIAAIAIVGACVLLFSLIGVAVFFLPLLAGVFKR